MVFSPFLMALVGLFACCSKRDHLMSILISMEFISLGLFFMIFIVDLMSGLELFQSLIFLAAVVCEGSLGIAIMINMVRSHGSDNVNSLSFLLC
uniref:NADH dehydrogenase subunit 4L n=1 Tax=Scalpellum stearnsi TaxID=748153 RepID=UPI00286B34E7|nr:NADH dehydrogenase subunit 4L [Scalpellum stearnsi]WKB17948.1 NADH dehydrogenase subunit 4L [Scalpellum stearnsi]